MQTSSSFMAPPFTQVIHKSSKGLMKLGMTLAQIVGPRQYEIDGICDKTPSLNQVPEMEESSMARNRKVNTDRTPE